VRFLIKKILKESEEEFDWDVNPFSEAEEFVYNTLSNSVLELDDEEYHYLDGKKKFFKSKNGDILLTITPPYTDEYYYNVGSPNMVKHKKPQISISSKNIVKPLINMGIEWDKDYHSSTEYVGGYKIPKGRSRKNYKEQYGKDIVKDMVKKVLNINTNDMNIIIGY
jgi:hypothetical protein